MKLCKVCKDRRQYLIQNEPVNGICIHEMYEKQIIQRDNINQAFNKTAEDKMINNCNETGFLPIAAAAEKMNTTIPKILMMLKQGVLKGEMLDGEWQISADSICGCPAPQSVPHAKGGCGGCSGCGS